MDQVSSSTIRSKEITQLLISWREGDPQALDRLLPLVYDPLRRIAASFLRFERTSHTLDTTSLVNEAYLRIVDQHQVQWRDRAQFMAIAGQIMRRVLVDHARRHDAAKRGGHFKKVSLAESSGIVSQAQPDLLDLDQALKRLAELDPQTARLVELRYFSGLTKNETAEVMGISSATVIRRWRNARAWLHSYLMQGESLDA